MHAAAHRAADPTLDNVLLELAVVDARAASWPSATDLRDQAALEPDALPVHLTPAELAAVLRLPLDDTLAHRLVHGAWGNAERLIADALA